MSTFGYRTLYENGVNSNTQLRRSTDFAFQRGATYEVVLTGDTYNSSMEIVADIYVANVKVGRMSITPYVINEIGGDYEYRFNIRPYDYISNFIKTEHHKYTWLNDWYTTNQDINVNNIYKNIVQFNIKYGYRYTIGNTTYWENDSSPQNDLDHFTQIPLCTIPSSYTATGFTNTGEYFNLIGGQFQMDEKYYLPNFDQEISTGIGTGFTVNVLASNRATSPMSQFLMWYPTVPESSENGRFLTESPRILPIQTNESHTLYYLHGMTGDRQWTDTEFARFDFFDENNNAITNFSQQLDWIYPPEYTNTLTINALPCGPVDIINLFSTIDFTDVAYYRVQLFTGLPTYRTESRFAECPVSEVFYFYIKENCLPESTRVVFLNSRGGYDYYTFTAFRNDTKKVTRQEFDNRYYSTNLSSPDRDFGRTVKTFDQSVDREIVLESDYISVPTGNWLEELFESPQVYIMKEDFISPIDRQDKIYKDLTPVQVLSTEVETITKKHRRLNKYRITLKVAQTYFTQRGF